LLASFEPIDVGGFRLYPEPLDAKSRGRSSRGRRVSRSASRDSSPARKPQEIHYGWAGAAAFFPEMPIRCDCLWPGGWRREKAWTTSSCTANSINEMGFVQRLLRPGMTVLDVGAHHGLYTLLLSKEFG